ncbi:MAG TPA: hypothetical protein VNJ53_13545 [Gaiellaceae bacterium]|nr:hypothetical protein [Gaiellaceae bacterium]
MKIEFGIWGGAGTSVEREWFALVGSRGADRPGGHAVLGAVTPTRSEVERACRTTRAAGPGNARGLGKRFAYRPAGAYVFFRADDGERILGEQLHRRSIDVVAARRSHGAAFTCLVGRGVVVRTRRTSSSPAPGWTLEVREGDELLAVASLRANAGWFRVATRCALD